MKVLQYQIRKTGKVNQNHSSLLPGFVVATLHVNENEKKLLIIIFSSTGLNN